MVCVELKSARVNMQRWWRFCCDACRDAWYEAADDADLAAVDGTAEGLHELDRKIVCAVHFVDRTGKSYPDHVAVRLHEALEHEDGASVNAYWREAVK